MSQKLKNKKQKPTDDSFVDINLEELFSNVVKKLLNNESFNFVSGKKYLILSLAGFIFVGVGIFMLWPKPEQEIKILSAETQSSKEQVKIKVDVSGAILNPGVYELPAEARVEEALQKAGGVTQEADHEWLSKNLNLAQKLQDGAKIYVPKTGEPVFTRASVSQGAVQGVTGKININTASTSELDTLAGIGLVTAKKIIDNRPYQNVEDLRTKKVLGEVVFQKIKDQLTVY